MTFRPPDELREVDDDVDPRATPHELPPDVVAAQRAHLRRILVAFFALVVLLPLAALGGSWSWLLLPLVAVAVLALREAISLRRSVSRHGAARGR